MSGEGTIEQVLAGEARWNVTCADCLDVLPTLADKSVDAVVTDPPYNVGLSYCDGDLRVDYREWTERWFSVCPRPLIVTPGVVNLAAWLVMSKPLWTCVWFKKNQCSPSAIGGFNAWEPVLVYGKLPVRVGADAWDWPIGTNQRDTGDHPCPKWAPFWTFLVGEFSKPDHIILDPFAGSGTTGVAALRLGRRVILIEREPKWAELCRERLRAEEQSSTLQARKAGQVAMFGGEK